VNFFAERDGSEGKEKSGQTEKKTKKERDVGVSCIVSFDTAVSGYRFRKNDPDCV
jgi:hypothetical protein